MHTMTQEEARKAHLRRILDIAECRGNRDDLSAECAARRLIAGLPAYWHSAVSSTGAAAALVSLANHGTRTIDEALSSTYGAGSESLLLSGSRATDALDALIPLNAEAAHELLMAYSRYGTFRELREVLSREREAIMSPHMPERTSIPDTYRMMHEAAQARFSEREREAHWGHPVTDPEKLGMIDAVQAGLEG